MWHFSPFALFHRKSFIVGITVYMCIFPHIFKIVLFMKSVTAENINFWSLVEIWVVSMMIQ